MNGWKEHHGRLVELSGDNIDTDQIIPARFMSQPRKLGYQTFLFHDLRCSANGEPKTDFALNRHSDASVLLCGANFGCGSSREAAAYALVDAGIRVVLATSFGDIFSGNAVNNGLLPAIIAQTDYQTLKQVTHHQSVDCTVDLTRCLVHCAGLTVAFNIEPAWRTKIINGWDDIDLTLGHSEDIESYRFQRKQQHPWAWPA